MLNSRRKEYTRKDRRASCDLPETEGALLDGV